MQHKTDFITDDQAGGIPLSPEESPDRSDGGICKTQNRKGTSCVPSQPIVAHCSQVQNPIRGAQTRPWKIASARETFASASAQSGLATTVDEEDATAATANVAAWTPVEEPRNSHVTHPKPMALGSPWNSGILQAMSKATKRHYDKRNLRFSTRRTTGTTPVRDSGICKQGIL